jgi:hypothetical protein
MGFELLFRFTGLSHGIHQPSGNGYQQRTFPSSGFSNCLRSSATATLDGLTHYL